MSKKSPPLIGTSPAKREDHALVTGQGQYADDIALTNPLHVEFLRSQTAQGTLTDLDLDDARAAPGVIAAHDGRDLMHLGELAVNPVIPVHELPTFQALTWPHITATGQPIAAILATSPADARNAAELAYGDPEEVEQTEKPSVAQQNWHAGDPDAAFKSAAHIVECTLHHPRLAPSPMEPRAIAVAYHPETDSVTIWHSTQTPHRSRSELANILNIDAARIRVIATHVGGAFGMKASLYPEDVFTVWAAFHHKRDVKWTATRAEEFLSATHGRGVSSIGKLALDADGIFRALSAEISAPIGPWLPNSGLITAWNAARILPSGYKIENLSIQTRTDSQNRAPTGIYRGAGRPEAVALIERLIDKAARATGLDPIEIRRKNLLPAAALPHNTATGNTLDSGDYSRALDLLTEKADYHAHLKTRDQRRKNGEITGIGIAFYLEPSGNGWESATVTLHPENRATVASGSSSQGHGRETAFAQIAAETLNLPLDQIDVLLADTAKTPPGIGALASRSTAIGGSAVLNACTEIQHRRAAGEPLPITVESVYENKGQAWGYGAYLASVSIDPATGTLALDSVTCVDDTGRIINPALVDGQIRGGFTQGMGEAMMERIVYDDHGQLLTGSFMDYAMPRAADIPPLNIHKFETPSPMNTLGAKGVGEAGTIGAPIAILNAAIDALSPLGVTDLQMPLTSHTLWQAIQSAQQGTSK